MDQEKIGKFILECRKSKGLTQGQLAEKLGVSDRSVSNWENGKHMPDLSLFKPLCDELDISINELLSGKVLKKEEIEKEADLNLYHTILDSKKKIHKNHRLLVVLFSLLFGIIILFGSFFVIDLFRMKEGREVFFSTWGFHYAPMVDLSNEKIEVVIRDYILSSASKEGHLLEKSFVSTKTYLIEERENKIFAYLWVVQENWYLENGKPACSTGYSIPHQFILEKNEDNYVVVSSKIPRDGSLYETDIYDLFPGSIRKKITSANVDGTTEKLSLDIEEQVSRYYQSN